jgi:aryl-alcohol dehydrogenase-like predicted oxidoreductase
MKLPRSKLAIGTAQFGQRYGVANTSGQVSPDAVAAILGVARERGIDTLDTAVSYGVSEACLGQIGVGGWRVVSKLPPLPGDDIDDAASWVDEQVEGSLHRLQCERLDGLLVHRAADLRGSQAAALITALTALRAQGRVAAVGVSIYDPGELDELWPSWQPDIVQAPCNVLDRRLIQSGWLTRLARHGVRVHLRSAFLQGLLLMPAGRRPAFFNRWQSLLDRWLAWCDSVGKSPLQAALGFVCALPEPEHVVVGVDSVAQLKEIVAASERDEPIPPADLTCQDRALLEPWRWELR